MIILKNMNEDLFIQKMVKLEADVMEIKESLLTVQDKVASIDDILVGQDKMIQILTRIDQERVFTNSRMERFEKQGSSSEERVMKLEKDVQAIKQHLQLA